MRIEGICCGDCSLCELAKSGQVDMVPCALDQIFQRVQRIEKIVYSFSNNKNNNLATMPNEEDVCIQ